MQTSKCYIELSNHTPTEDILIVAMLVAHPTLGWWSTLPDDGATDGVDCDHILAGLSLPDGSHVAYCVESKYSCILQCHGVASKDAPEGVRIEEAYCGEAILRWLIQTAPHTCHDQQVVPVK